MSLIPQLEDVAEMFDNLYDLFAKKNHDYGNSVFETCELAPSISVEDAIAVRMSDKVKRISKLRANGGVGQVKEESLDDTIIDLVVYGVLWVTQRKVNRSKSLMSKVT